MTIKAAFGKFVGEMSAVYKKKDKEISASVGESFIIELEGNPTTGYEWQLQIDSSKVKLIDHQHQLASGRLGAGSKERFIIQPIKKGSTSIRAEYKRAWEPMALEKEEFHLRVK